jgi:diguanylate cyclase
VDKQKDTAESEQWKRKYFDQLEEAETREKQWRQTDDLLRKTISRLTLAAEGQNEKLDGQLRDLRNAIRDHANATQLKTAIDAMSATLVSLDREKKRESSGDTDASLLLLLDALSLPRGTGRKARALRKLLVGGNAEPSRVVSEFVGLIDAAIDLSRDSDKAETGKSPRSGLLQRLFGEPDKAAREDSTVTADRPSETPGATGADKAGSVREILVQLLERLSLPDDLAEQLEAVRDRIEATRDSDAWDGVIEQIADLVQAIRTRTQKEKQGIENFLLQLTGRLQEWDRQLADSEQYYDETLAAGEELDDAVKQGISGIESGVREATDLSEIKQLVQTHIDTVLMHMEKHRQVEQRRYDKAKAEISIMNERLHSMENEADELRSRISEERIQAQTDTLTGIPNRLAYEERLEQEIARWKRFSTPLVLLIWDIDYFKNVNDTFGHKAGDKVLRTIARKLSQSIRETDFIARYGGEEFVHLMTGSNPADCLRVADKLRTLVQETGFHFRGEAVTITASCGLAEIRDGDSVEQWFERADQALYKAKRDGRNRCELALE